MFSADRKVNLLHLNLWVLCSDMKQPVQTENLKDKERAMYIIFCHSIMKQLPQQIEHSMNIPGSATIPSSTSTGRRRTEYHAIMRCARWGRRPMLLTGRLKSMRLRDEPCTNPTITLYRLYRFIDDEYWWIMNDHECHVLFLDQWREKPWSLTNPGNGWQWKIPIIRMNSHESWVFGISHCHANSNWTIECFGKGIGSITCTKLSPKSWWEDGAVHPWNSPRPGGAAGHFRTKFGLRIRWLIMITHQFAIFSFLLNGNLGI